MAFPQHNSLKKSFYIKIRFLKRLVIILILFDNEVTNDVCTFSSSHKYSTGDVVVFAVNLDPRNDAMFSLNGPLAKLKADSYALEPVGDVTSK